MGSSNLRICKDRQIPGMNEAPRKQDEMPSSKPPGFQPLLDNVLNFCLLWYLVHAVSGSRAGGLAQLVERLNGIQEVGSSSLLPSTSLRNV